MSSTMPDYTGWIVRAQAGRDKGGLFCVMGIVQEGRRLLLADGKRRRAARPKVKAFHHVKLLTDGFDHPAEAGRGPERQGTEKGAGRVPRSTGGMTLWQKTT